MHISIISEIYTFRIVILFLNEIAHIYNARVVIINLGFNEYSVAVLLRN